MIAVNAFSHPKVVIVGSSFIGLECAAVLTKYTESILVIGMEKVHDIYTHVI
jgi:NADPH-dependent 2,4-dienoyl-CoA reductase/sulfur reductase-like enzyme